MSNEVQLDLSELVTALKETAKVQIAVNYARLVVPTVDEDGNDRPDEEVQADLEAVFEQQVQEFEQTLEHTAQRLIKAKAEAQAGLQVVEGGGIQTP